MKDRKGPESLRIQSENPNPMLKYDVLISSKTFLFWREEKEVYYASKKQNLEANLLFLFQYIQ